jgi:hypothetical protein
MHLSPILITEVTKKVNKYKIYLRMIVFLAVPILVISWMIGTHIATTLLHYEMMSVGCATFAGFLMAFIYIRIETNIEYTLADLKRLEEVPESLRTDPINGVVSLERQVNRSFWDVLKRGF